MESPFNERGDRVATFQEVCASLAIKNLCREILVSIRKLRKVLPALQTATINSRMVPSVWN